LAPLLRRLILVKITESCKIFRRCGCQWPAKHKKSGVGLDPTPQLGGSQLGRQADATLTPHG
jgi:hypothetical protein